MAFCERQFDSYYLQQHQVKIKPSEMLSLIEGESYNLQFKDQSVSCRLLSKGNHKKVEEAMKSFQAELDGGKSPSELRKKVLAAPKAPVVDDVNFLSRSRAPVMSSREVCLGQSTERKKSKKAKVEKLTQPAVLQGSQNKNMVKNKGFCNNFNHKPDHMVPVVSK